MLDVVIAGPDMSGTTTQIQDAIDFFLSRSLYVRDMRGSDIDALFHAERFNAFNAIHTSLEAFLNDPNVSRATKEKLMFDLGIEIRKMEVASFVENSRTNFVNPNKANVWVFEEPPKRGSGIYCRVFEQNRGEFQAKRDPVAEAHSHADYRVFEYFAYRRILRELEKIILRSRSEESRTYQQYDKDFLPDGIPGCDYDKLPGHKIAYFAAPTHVLIGHGPTDWSREDYLKFKQERTRERLPDGFEEDFERQLLVNRRYAQVGWLETVYRNACKKYHGIEPRIIRFDMRMSMPEIKEFVWETLAGIEKGL